MTWSYTVFENWARFISGKIKSYDYNQNFNFFDALRNVFAVMQTHFFQQLCISWKAFWVSENHMNVVVNKPDCRCYKFYILDVIHQGFNVIPIFQLWIIGLTKQLKQLDSLNDYWSRRAIKEKQSLHTKVIFVLNMVSVFVSWKITTLHSC